MVSVNTPYDDVFRTMLNDCRELILPVLNELFGEHYTGTEDVVFSPNEHFLNQQNGKETLRVTDSSFEVISKETKKYHCECQSTADSSLLVRFFEYGAQIALDQGELKGNLLTVTFPHAAVLFLRCKATTPDKMKIRMMTPGGMVEYDVLVMKVPEYSLESIFKKNLLFLLPFYIFSHEHHLAEYNTNVEKLEDLKREYKKIVAKLERLTEIGIISTYTKNTIQEMSEKVVEHLAAKYENLKEGVKSVMGGKILEYEAKTILNMGKKEGLEEGQIQGALLKSVKGVYNLMMKKDFTKEEAMDMLDVSIEDREKVSKLVEEKIKKPSIIV